MSWITSLRTVNFFSCSDDLKTTYFCRVSLIFPARRDSKQTLQAATQLFFIWQKHSLWILFLVTSEINLLFLLLLNHHYHQRPQLHGNQDSSTIISLCGVSRLKFAFYFKNFLKMTSIGQKNWFDLPHSGNRKLSNKSHTCTHTNMTANLCNFEMTKPGDIWSACS